ncbi:MAG: hypothetical protein HY289_15395, partial [Planctomycetes bacterium]|nr:hypothetical protein [Planctomycetota bacterium]
VDYPNHLARGYILYHHIDVPSFTANFDVDWLTPSVAMDAFLCALQPICDVRIAGKIFLTLTIWLWLAGWHLLGWAIHGRPTWLALGGGVIAYHSQFLYGFTNYSFGLGLFLVALAAWIHWRTRWSAMRLTFMTLLALASCFSHLSALIFLAGAALALTGSDALRQRAVTTDMLLGLAPVLAPFAIFLRGGGSSGFEYGTLMNKLAGALCLVRGYHRHVDAAFIAGLAIFLVLFVLWSTGKRCNPGTLIAGLGCVVMFLVGPHEIFGGSPADARFLPPAAALIVLSFDFSYPRRAAVVLLFLFLMLTVFRCGALTHFWQSFDTDLRDQAALFDTFPENAKVYPMVNVSDQPDEQKLGLASFHAINYAVIDRHIYVPHLLAYRGQQPIRYLKEPLTFHDNPLAYPAYADVDWNKICAKYDYLWCWDLPEVHQILLSSRATRVAQKGNASIWKVRKPPEKSLK